MSESEDILSQPSDSNQLIDDLTCSNLNVHSAKKSQRSKFLTREGLFTCLCMAKYKQGSNYRKNHKVRERQLKPYSNGYPWATIATFKSKPDPRFIPTQT